MPVTAPSTVQESEQRAGPPGHMPALDGVRGLAILLVLGDHLLQSNGSTGNPFFDFVSAIRVSLWVGVDLFFALSGFLITGILFDSLQSGRYFRSFYARRALRIFPLYFGFLLFLICLTYPLHLQWQGKQYLLLTYTQNLRIWVVDYVGFRPAPFINLNHFWSLAVEEQFYFFWPMVVFLVRDLRKLFYVALGLSVGALLIRIFMALHGVAPYNLFEFTPCRIDALLVGGSLALLTRSRFRAAVLTRSVPVFVVLLAALICLGFRFGGLRWDTNYLVATLGLTLTSLTSTAFIAMSLARVSLTRFGLENRFMRFFGKYSYGIYVFHYPLDAALTRPLRQWMFSTFHSKTMAVSLGSVCVILVTVLIAFCSYQLFEKKFLRLKHYF
ncbi:MAG TPA: acyltransferase [Terracidiphilus sp.]|jgi:peptidoglycan/LPS O-acetylase OafA/YrhL